MADQTEAAPAQAIGTQPLRRVAKQPIEYTAQLDVLQLIVRFLIRARDGAPFSFTTFKETWKQIGFSHLFQACPSSRTSLPSLINSLYNFLLHIIKTETLPLREVFELANPLSPLNQQALTNNQGDGADNSRPLPCLTPENVAWATAPAVQGPPVVSSAVYCLYSIYYVQPGPLTVKIRISKEHQHTITHLATYLAQSNALDALSLLTQLVKDNALLPGASQQSDASLTNININRTTATLPTVGGGGGLDIMNGGPGAIPASTLAPGMGALYIVPGLRGEDAATVREVNFHLDSTLTGLGTAHLDPLCRGYGRKLKDLWIALGQTAPEPKIELPPVVVEEEKVVAKKRGGKRAAVIKKSAKAVKTTKPAAAPPARTAPAVEQQEEQPEGIADLSMGKYLHEYATKKREELQLTLQYGPKWREKLTRKEKESGASMPSRAAPHPPSRAGRKKAPRSRKKMDTDTSLNIPGVPGVARQLLAREKARHVDIARRSQPWATRMGVDNVIEKEIQAAITPFGGLIDSDEDMPLLPGLPSEYEYLAGPSDVADVGGGGALTKMTDTTIQGKRKKVRGNNSSDGSTASSSSSSSSDSSSSDSSSSDESDSGGEEVEMHLESRGARGKGKAVGAVGVGSQGRGRGRGGRGGGGKAAGASVGSGMRGGKKSQGAKAATGGRKKGSKVTAAAVEDVQNLLSEIDMALAEDARIQL